MTKIGKYPLVCSNCKNKFKARLYDSINVTSDPSLIQLVSSEKFNVVECPKCHQEFYVAKEFLFHDMNKKIMMWIKPKDMGSFLIFLEKEGYFKKVDKISKREPIWHSLKNWLRDKFSNLNEGDKLKSKTVTREEWEKILEEKEKKKQEKIELEEIRNFRHVEKSVEGQIVVQIGQDVYKVETVEDIPKIRTEFKGCCEFCSVEVTYIFDRFY